MFLALLVLSHLAPSLALSNLTLKNADNPRIEKIEPENNIVTIAATITAYSSTPEQTDETPFITASGETVADGIVACNFLKFNTTIKLPELFGDKIFIVKDRMAKKNSHKIDIWFPTTKAALNFGIKKTQVEILPNQLISEQPGAKI